MYNNNKYIEPRAAKSIYCSKSNALFKLELSVISKYSTLNLIIINKIFNIIMIDINVS